MAGLERDPNALAALLRMQPQIPQQTDEEAQLSSMIPEEQLYQAQEAQADAGRARGGPYAVSSRDQLRESGMAELRKMFGIQQAKAQAAALPARVTGEYGMANRRLQNQGALDVANVNQTGAAARETGLNTRATQALGGMNERAALGQTGANERSAAGRASAERIAAANRTGRSDVAGANQAAITARKNPPGILDWLRGNKPAAAAPAASPDVAALLDPTNIQNNVAQIQAQHPGIPIEELISQGEVTFDSPEEEAATIAAYGR